MNSSKEEKLALISELIELARADRKITKEELQFIKVIASSIEISNEQVEQLIKKPVASKVIKLESERITQFHRLVLVMNIDQQTSIDEILVLKKFGLQMGFPESAIDEVLQRMNHYKNKLIPPDILINIFKKHHN